MERKQRQRIEKRNLLKDIPQDITKHVGKYLDKHDRLSEVSQYFNNTLNTNPCVRKTQFGARCLKDVTNLNIGPDCFAFCSKHFDKIIIQWLDMITSDITVIDNQNKKWTAKFLFLVSYDGHKPLWSSSQKYNYVTDINDRAILIYDLDEEFVIFEGFGTAISKYNSSSNNIPIPLKNVTYTVRYIIDSEQVLDFPFREVLTFDKENNIEVVLNPNKFSWDFRNTNTILFKFNTENVVPEEEFKEEEEKMEEEFKEVMQEEKMIDCEDISKNAMLCTNNLFDDPNPRCQDYCATNFLDGVINLIVLITENPLFIESRMNGSIFAYQLSNNYTIIILNQDDILLEITQDDALDDLVSIIITNEWTHILVGYPKSKSNEGIVKLYVQIYDSQTNLIKDVIRLKGFHEDQSHIILTINNSGNLLMNEPD